MTKDRNMFEKFMEKGGKEGGVTGVSKREFVIETRVHLMLYRFHHVS